MIGNFKEFLEKSKLNEEEERIQQLGNRNENMLFSDLDQLKFELGEGSSKNEILVSMMDSVEGTKLFDVDKLNNDYYEFVDVYAPTNSSNGHLVGDDVFIVFGNEKDGYDYEKMDAGEFSHKYKK